MILLIGPLFLLLAAPAVLGRMRARRDRLLLTTQLRQSLESIVHALRVGVAFSQALEYVTRDGAAPLVDEWRRTLQSVKLGASLSDALAELGRRVTIPEMQWFVAAVQITQSTGGSLADVLETLAETMRERQSLRDKVGALTAQGKASGVVLSLLPFVLLATLQIVVPKLVHPMFVTALGQALLVGVMISVAIGGLVIWKIVSIEVD